MCLLRKKQTQSIALIEYWSARLNNYSFWDLLSYNSISQQLMCQFLTRPHLWWLYHLGDERHSANWTKSRIHWVSGSHLLASSQFTHPQLCELVHTAELRFLSLYSFHSQQGKRWAVSIWKVHSVIRGNMNNLITLAPRQQTSFRRRTLENEQTYQRPHR